MDNITICEKCNEPIPLGAWPFCPHPTDGHYGVTGDDIPGGIEIKHGLCNLDGSPRKYYSKSEINREAKKRGLVNLVTHVSDPKSGSDKNPYTTRWI